MSKEFYSNGKLLLTGEYAVLDGALGLAVPTKYGQHLTVTKTTGNTLSWKSYDLKNSLWFEASFDSASMALLKEDKQVKNWLETAETLQSILRAAKKLNSRFINKSQGYRIETKLSFPRNWGLGSSSTLINNIALWAEINAFTLLNETMGGSGYDIACAQHNTPIFYQRNEDIPRIETIAFNPVFANNLYFVHLNQKQNSREAIAAYRNCLFDKEKLLNAITDITQRIAISQSLTDFEQLINRHEEILSEVLQTPTVKDRLFSDYEGSIKSLGAWGGDFILATGTAASTSYFKNKGYQTILSYTDMVK